MNSCEAQQTENNSQTNVNVSLLTATVRTLQVNKRQITRSIARQLDEISWQDIKPLGRARIYDRGTEIIGADKDGNLVRSTVFADEAVFIGDHDLKPYGRPYDYRYDFEMPESIFDGFIRPMRRNQIFISEFPDITITLGPSESFVITEPQMLDKFLVQCAANEHYQRSEKDKLRSLPLIVLAGLR